MSRLLTKADITFLKDLQHELNTQDNCDTPDPHYWKIQETVRARTFDDGADETLFDVEGNRFLYYGIEAELLEFMRLNELGYERDLDCLEYKELFETCKQIFEEEHGYSTFPYDFGYTEKVTRLANPLFFTLKGCEEHIKQYGYNYENPNPYCIYSDRTSTFEKLLEILKHVDFDSLEVAQ